ncbi:MAG: hypothetical protein ACXVCG_09875 [Bdellovibrionota bacterium]
MREKILECIYAVLTELKGELNRGKEIRLEEGASLYDSAGPLDSVDLVRVIVLLEEKLKERFGVSVRIASSAAFNEKKSPFQSIGLLATYLEPLLASSERSK